MIRSEQLAEQFIDMSDAIKRVRNLHISRQCCAEPFCGIICVECQVDYPCLTIKALDGEQNG